MKNELNAELLQALVEEFVNKNIKILGKISSSKEDIYSKDFDYENKEKLIEDFYEELKYVHNIYDFNLDEIKSKIRDAQIELTKKKEHILNKLKETDYIYNFVFNNYNDITERKIEGLMNFLREKGFYPLDREDLMDYIKSIEIIEEEIPYKPNELKTQLDEEFREYVLKFVNLLEKQRIKFGISEEKFKTIILKVLKINNYDTKDSKYDYKTKKYYLLKEIAETPKEIEPYYLVKYYNIQTGKIYYSVYYGSGTLIYNKIPSREKAILMTKNIDDNIKYRAKQSPQKETTPEIHKEKQISIRDKSTSEINQSSPEIKTTKERPPSEITQEENLSYEDEEILSDQEYIKEHIQNIHKRQEEKLYAKGNKLFPIFKIIALILAFTVIGIPFSLMILLAFRTNQALTETKTKAKSKTFLLVCKILGLILFIPLIIGIVIILVVLLMYLAQNKMATLTTNPLFLSGIVSAVIGFMLAMPSGILLIMLSYITERAEQKYKVEHSKRYKTTEKENSTTESEEKSDEKELLQVIKDSGILEYDSNSESSSVSDDNEKSGFDDSDTSEEKDIFYEDLSSPREDSEVKQYTSDEDDLNETKESSSMNETDDTNPYDIDYEEENDVFGKEENIRDDYDYNDYNDEYYNDDENEDKSKD